MRCMPKGTSFDTYWQWLISVDENSPNIKLGLRHFVLQEKYNLNGYANLRMLRAQL